MLVCAVAAGQGGWRSLPGSICAPPARSALPCPAIRARPAKPRRASHTLTSPAKPAALAKQAKQAKQAKPRWCSSHRAAASCEAADRCEQRLCLARTRRVMPGRARQPEPRPATLAVPCQPRQNSARHAGPCLVWCSSHRYGDGRPPPCRCEQRLCLALPGPPRLASPSLPRRPGRSPPCRPRLAALPRRALPGSVLFAPCSRLLRSG